MEIETTVGVESEAGLVDAQGRPVSVSSMLEGITIPRDRKFESLDGEMGDPMVELVTCVCENADQIGDSLERVMKLLPSGVTPIFKAHPFSTPVAVSRKSRATAMIAALIREDPEHGHKGVSTVAQWCSTQIQIGMNPWIPERARLFRDILDNIAPYSRAYVNQKYGITGAEGHLMIWQGWCNPARVPAPRRFQSATEYERYITSTPRLVVLKNGIWVPADGEMSVFGDRYDEGTFWLLARNRIEFKSTEWRPFPPTQPHQTVQLVGEALVLTRAFHEHVDAHPEVLLPGADLSDMYKALSKASKLVPPAPLSEFEWWRLYRL